MPDGMNDIDFSSEPAGNAAEIAQVTPQAVEDAAKAVVTAAAGARSREFKWKSQVAVSPEIGDLLGDPGRASWTKFDDMANGECWISAGDHRFVVTDHPTMGSYSYVRYYGNDDPMQPWEGQYEWIGEKFEYFHERWSSFPLTMGQHCDDAKLSIQSGEMTAIKDVSDVVVQWQGKAQQGFSECFLNPYMVTTLTNQQGLLDELAVAMYAYEGLLKESAGNAKKIADQAVEVFEGLHEGSGGGFSAVLDVVGVVLRVVTVAATAGGSTPFVVGLGLLGAGVQAAQVVDKDQKVEGSNTDELVTSLSDTLDQFKKAMDAEEQSIADAVTSSVGWVTSTLDSSSPSEVATVLPNEPDDDGVPNISDGNVPAPGDFHPR